MIEVSGVEKLEVKIMGIKNSSVRTFTQCSYTLTSSHLIVTRKIGSIDIKFEVHEHEPINLDTIISFRVTE